MSILNNFKTKTTKVLLLSGLLAFGLHASPIYMTTQPGGVGATNQIGILDPLTGATSSVHSTVSDSSATGFGIAAGTSLEFFDIAINTLNEINGVTRQTPSGSLAGLQQLWRINGATGVAQLVAANLSGAMSTINGLAFNPTDGRLFLSGSSGTIFSTDLGACALGGQFTNSCGFSAANSVALGSNSRGDIEFFNGALFLAGEDDKVYRLGLSAGNWSQDGVSAAALTSLGGSFTLKGLANNGTSLYVGGDIFGGTSPQAIALLNATTLTISGIQPITGINSNVAGLAGGGSAVPEPSVFMLSTIGLGLIAFSRRKKKQQ